VTNSTTGIRKVKLVSNREGKIISVGHEGVCGGVELWLLSLTYARLEGQWFMYTPPVPFSFKEKPVPLGTTVRLFIFYN